MNYVISFCHLEALSDQVFCNSLLGLVTVCVLLPKLVAVIRHLFGAPVIYLDEGECELVSHSAIRPSNGSLRTHGKINDKTIVLLEICTKWMFGTYFIAATCHKTVNSATMLLLLILLLQQI